MLKLKLALLISALLVLSSSVFADKANLTSLGQLTFPDVQGKSCVIKDTLEMRKNHMNYLLHRRNETVRDGKRWSKKTHSKNFSIEKCINCHARDEKGTAVKLKLGGGKLNSKHFCQNCHNYTAVSIDCFSCHSAVPTGKAKTAANKQN